MQTKTVWDDKRHLYATAYYPDIGAHVAVLAYYPARDEYLCNAGYADIRIKASDLTSFCL